MSDLKHWAWTACDAINHVVESGESFEEIHTALQRIRKFLEARASQTAPPWPEDQPSTDFSDLLGV